MLELIIIIPLATGILTFFIPPALGRSVVAATGLTELILSSLSLAGKIEPATQYFRVSPDGGYILLITIFLFLVVSLYAISYLAETEMHREPVFNGCSLLFLAAMTMVCIADHIIVLWIAVEATTLASAPLILLHHSKDSLEATWKYVMICSVGIALALLGSFFIVLAINLPDADIPLTLSNLRIIAGQMNPVWLKAGFIFILIGFGTKMGLAPMHTWLPDAHSEAPSPASALLSGALLNCAFLGIFKIYTIMQLAGLGHWAGNLLSSFGLFSILLAGIFIFQQHDLKRLLAYSSIENMGIIALGTGIGGLAGFGAMLHLLHHSLIKSSLFLSAGNILLSYGAKEEKKVGNMPRLLPGTLAGFGSGFAGISGFPPFGLFLSELLIIVGLCKNHRYLYAGLFILGLILVFSGAAKTFIRMSFSPFDKELVVREKWGRLIPSYLLLGCSVVFCLWMPEYLIDTLNSIVSQMGGLINE